MSIMRDRIWTELTQAKFNLEFTALYIDRQRCILRYFNIAILVFSTSGIMGWSFWDNLPLIACIVIAIVSLLRLIQPHLIMTDKQLTNLDSIHRFYVNYYNKLEKLWYDLEDSSLDNEIIKKLFFEIKHTEEEINPIINETVRTKPKNLVKKANSYSTQYFKLSFQTI